jgi:hypothetical protein
MYIYGIRTHCQGNSGKLSACTNNGRYCATDPDNDLDRGISGADVVKAPVVSVFGSITEETVLKWWKYVEEFTNRCNTPDCFRRDCVRIAEVGVLTGTKSIVACSLAASE